MWVGLGLFAIAFFLFIGLGILGRIAVAVEEIRDLWKEPADGA